MTAKIKIAHVVTRMDKGGAPDIVRILFEKLDPGIFELTLIYGRTTNPSEKTKDFLARIAGRAILVPSLERDINLVRDALAFLRLLSVFRHNRFDIVHTHTAKAGVLGRIAARLSGARRVIHSSHGHDFYGYFGPLGSRLVVWAEKFAGLFCDKIHALTELEKRDMLAFGICPERKIEVIYSGIEPVFLKAGEAEAKRNEFLKKEEKFLVGMVGRLEPIKGPRYFIEAAIRVFQVIKEAKFLVVGDGSLKRPLEDMVSNAGMKDKVIFTGWREDAQDIYSAIDIMVLPSLNEAVGRSVLEAAASGVPVVATRVGGVPEIVKDNETGILVPPKDPKALAEKIISLLQDGPMRKRMADNARLAVNERFSDSRMVEGFTNMYKGMMEIRK